MRFEINKFFNYLLGKRSEIQDLDVKDIMLTKVILDIHRKRIAKKFIMVPLFSVKPIHLLDRDNAMTATEKRAAMLNQHKDEILAKGKIDRSIMGELLPSVSWIKVVKEADDSYIAYEGNGRLGAMHQVFTPEDGVLLEVEEYLFRDTAKIIRRMNRVRRMNGLLESWRLNDNAGDRR